LCISERDRERESEENTIFFLNSVRLTNYLPIIQVKLQITQPYYCSHVNKREIERRPHPFSTSGHAESLVNYVLEMTEL
jgi:hypothetical protein